jgi:hypothetical protein
MMSIAFIQMNEIGEMSIFLPFSDQFPMMFRHFLLLKENFGVIFSHVLPPFFIGVV